MSAPLRYSYCSRSKPGEQFILCSLSALQNHLTFPFLLGRSLLKMLSQQPSNKPLYFTAQLKYSWSRSTTTVLIFYQASHMLTKVLEKKKKFLDQVDFHNLALLQKPHSINHTEKMMALTCNSGHGTFDTYS